MGSVEKGENRRGDKRSEKRLQRLKEVKEEEKVRRQERTKNILYNGIRWDQYRERGKK